MSHTKYNAEQIRREIQPTAYRHLRKLLDDHLGEQNRELMARCQSRDYRKMEVAKLDDLSIYRCKLLGEQPGEDEIEDDQERDDDLRQKIEQYNLSNKASREKDKDKGRRGRRIIDKEESRKRKIRTTITQQKLDQMNRIFSEYIDNKEKLAEADDKSEDSQIKNARQKLEITSLKSIGERLGLGYSTILHKFRQFRATKKVKGGALIAATQQKRKYKKSKDIEQLIERSLSEKKFFTAVELSKYILEKYHRSLSRSIISRHLGEMGYSYKNIKNVPVNKNASILKKQRKEYAGMFTKMKQINKAQIYFLDQCTFTARDFPLKQFGNLAVHQQDNGPQLSALLLANMKDELFQSADFEKLFDQLIEGFSEEDDGQYKVIVLDMKEIHQGERILEQRLQLKEKHVVLFYTPPYSGQFNLLTFIFQKIKAALREKEYETREERLYELQEAFNSFGEQGMAICEKELTEHIRKAYRQQNF